MNTAQILNTAPASIANSGDAGNIIRNANDMRLFAAVNDERVFPGGKEAFSPKLNLIAEAPKTAEALSVDGEIQRAAEFFHANPLKSLDILDKALVKRKKHPVALRARGLTLLAIGKFAEAAEAFNDAANNHDKKDEFAVENQLYLGIAHVKSLECIKALTTLDAALEDARGIESRRLECHILSNIGLLYLEQGERKLSIDHQKKALELAQKDGDTTLQSMILGHLAASYARSGDAERAYDSSREAIGLLDPSKDKIGAASALSNFAVSQIQRQEYDDAKESIGKALDCSKELQDDYGISRDLSVLALLRAKMGLIKEATVFYDESIEYGKKIGDNRKLAEKYLLKGDFLVGIDQPREASLCFFAANEALEKSLPENPDAGSGWSRVDSSRRENCRVIKTMILAGLARSYIALGKEAEIKEDIEKARRHFEKINDQTGRGIFLLNMAKEYSQKGKFHQDLSLCEEAFAAGLEGGDVNLQSEALHGKILALLGLSMRAEAEAALAELEALSKELSDKRLLSGGYAHLGAYCAAGKASNKYLDRAIELTDRLVEDGASLHTKVDNLFLLGQAKRRSGDSQSAVDYFRESLELGSAILGKRKRASTLNHLGMAYAESGELDKAIGLFRDALGLWTEDGFKGGMREAYFNLGLAYLQSRQFGESAEHTAKSLELCEELGLNDRMIECHNNLAVAYFESGKDRLSFENFRAMVNETSIDENRKMRLIALDYVGKLGAMLEELGDAKAAFAELAANYSASDSRESKQKLAETKANLGGVYLAEGDIDTARKEYQAAATLFRELGHEPEARFVENYFDNNVNHK